ncbi:MAG: vWA domain-containing protein, partial [Patescibacteria group bacterium]
MKLKTLSKKNNGIASYMSVLLLTFIAVLVVAVIQTRLLLAVSRKQSFSDTLITTYRAESEIYDIFERILGYDAPLPANGIFTLSDNATLEVMSQEDPTTHTQTVIVTAKRPYAVSKIEAIKTTTEVSGGVENIEMILAFDCTGSMNGSACAAGSSCTATNDRWQAQRQAIIDFITTIKNSPQNDHIFIGLLAFGGSTKWMSDGSGNLIPTNNHQRLLDAVITQFSNANNGQGLTEICRQSNVGSTVSCQNGTNIGEAYMAMHRYFAVTPPLPGSKRVELVTTDGDSNARCKNDTDVSFCPKNIRCGFNDGPDGKYCMPYGRDYL